MNKATFEVIGYVWHGRTCLVFGRYQVNNEYSPAVYMPAKKTCTDGLHTEQDMEVSAKDMADYFINIIESYYDSVKNSIFRDELIIAMSDCVLARGGLSNTIVQKHVDCHKPYSMVI